VDFELNEEQKMVIEEAKKFAEKKLAPAVEKLDEKQEVNLAALFFAGHDFDKTNAMPGNDHRNCVMIEILNRLAISFTRIGKGNCLIGGLGKTFHLGHKRVISRNVDNNCDRHTLLLVW
jgi:hypothetical protein